MRFRGGRAGGMVFTDVAYERIHRLDAVNVALSQGSGKPAIVEMLSGNSASVRGDSTGKGFLVLDAELVPHFEKTGKVVAKPVAARMKTGGAGISQAERKRCSHSSRTHPVKCAGRLSYVRGDLETNDFVTPRSDDLILLLIHQSSRTAAFDRKILVLILTHIERGVHGCG